MKRLFPILLVFSAIFLAGCQTETESSHPAELAPTIDHATAKPFLKKLAEDYLTFANALQTESNNYYKNDDLENFLIYRNKEWTPNYMSQKLFYEKTLEQNKSYINQHKLEKPFEIFSSLIYIGIDIKHGFQNHDNAGLANAYKLLEKDRRYMQKIKVM